MNHKPQNNWKLKEERELEERLGNFKQAKRDPDTGILMCPDKTLYGCNIDIAPWKRKA